MDLNKLTKKQLIELLQNMVEEDTKEEVKEEQSAYMHWTKGDLYKIKDEVIEVQSLSDGVVTFISPKSRNKYKWHNKGDIEFMSIEEVMLMNNKPLFLQTPLLRISDIRVIEGLGLDYSVIDRVSNLEEFIKLDIDTIRATIEQLSDDYVRDLKGDIIKAIKYSNLSYTKVNELIELFDINRLDLQ